MVRTNEMELVKFKSDIVNLGFEVISLPQFYNRPDPNRHIPHIVNFHVIFLITEGKGKHEIDFKVVEYDKNHVVFINKGQEHRWIDYQGTNGYIILFTEDFLFKNQLTFKDLSYTFPFNSYLYKPHITLDNIQSDSFTTLVEYLFQEYHQPYNEHKGEILQCLLRTLLIKVKSKKPVHHVELLGDQEKLFIRFQKMIDRKVKESRNIMITALGFLLPTKGLIKYAKHLPKPLLKFF